MWVQRVCLRVENSATEKQSTTRRIRDADRGMGGGGGRRSEWLICVLWPARTKEAMLRSTTTTWPPWSMRVRVHRWVTHSFSFSSLPPPPPFPSPNKPSCFCVCKETCLLTYNNNWTGCTPQWHVSQLAHVYGVFLFSISLSLAGNSGYHTRVRHSNQNSSASHSYQCVQYLCGSKQWYGC